MFARMGVPLICGLVLQLRGGMLAQAGVLFYLAAFYPVTLTLETALSLPSENGDDQGPKVSQNATS